MTVYLSVVSITLQYEATIILPRRFQYKSHKQLNNVLRRQSDNDDLFITKYGNDETIYNIILDFDGKDDKEKVYNEVLTLHRFLKRKNLNSVIVSSTNKGYHFYLQIPPVQFNEQGLGLDKVDRNKCFVLFSLNMIQQSHFKFSSLDYTNTHAGLGGNIRLLGSIHPKTHKRVEIINGEFIDANEYETYYDKCKGFVYNIYKASLTQYKLLLEHKTKEYLQKQKKSKKLEWKHDPIRENDLRIVLPSLYGGTVNKYDGYNFMTCPWHVDRKPSLKVTKEWFYCTGCGKKGNIWTLIKDGEISREKVLL